MGGKIKKGIGGQGERENRKRGGFHALEHMFGGIPRPLRVLSKPLTYKIKCDTIISDAKN